MPRGSTVVKICITKNKDSYKVFNSFKLVNMSGGKYRISLLSKILKNKTDTLTDDPDGFKKKRLQIQQATHRIWVYKLFDNILLSIIIAQYKMNFPVYTNTLKIPAI